MFFTVLSINEDTNSDYTVARFPRKRGKCLRTRCVRLSLWSKVILSFFLSKLKLNSIRPQKSNKTLLLSYAIMIHLRKQSYWTVHDGWLTAVHPKTQQRKKSETSLNAINLTVSAQYKLRVRASAQTYIRNLIILLLLQLK